MTLVHIALGGNLGDRMANLEAAIAAREFRDDLYHRLCVVPFHLSPLREHIEDVKPLANHFVGLASDALTYDFAIDMNGTPSSL